MVDFLMNVQALGLLMLILQVIQMLKNGSLVDRVLVVVEIVLRLV